MRIGTRFGAEASKFRHFPTVFVTFLLTFASPADAAAGAPVDARVRPANPIPTAGTIGRVRKSVALVDLPATDTALVGVGVLGLMLIRRRRLNKRRQNDP